MTVNLSPPFQPIMAGMGEGVERPLWEQVVRLDAPNSVAGRTIPRLDGTVSEPVGKASISG